MPGAGRVRAHTQRQHLLRRGGEPHPGGDHEASPGPPPLLLRHRPAQARVGGHVRTLPAQRRRQGAEAPPHGGVLPPRPVGLSPVRAVRGVRRAGPLPLRPHARPLLRALRPAHGVRRRGRRLPRPQHHPGARRRGPVGGDGERRPHEAQHVRGLLLLAAGPPFRGRVGAGGGQDARRDGGGAAAVRQRPPRHDPHSQLPPGGMAERLEGPARLGQEVRPQVHLQTRWTASWETTRPAC